jgi:hypothetical protein
MLLGSHDDFLFGGIVAGLYFLSSNISKEQQLGDNSADDENKFCS